MQDPKRILITAALPYANGPLHIGHMAGNFLPADVYARFQKSKKRPVLFVCGSDEHGVPITIRAMKEGVTPQEIVDRYNAEIQEGLKGMGVTFDNYSRTTHDLHRQTAQDFFTNLYEKGIFEETESEQFYDPKAEQFLADRYIIGTCPNCGFEAAYGDQCENCGTSLSPEELIDPKSALSDAPIEKRVTKHWYFPLQKYEEWLKKWILESHADWKPNVLGQCKSWLDAGLRARAMTRDSEWGVPVPLEDEKGKVLYVWFDAPIGYITSTKEATSEWETFWKQEDTKLVHFIGKDNIVFHCIIFPSMLKAHGDYILPEAVPANEFLNIEGQKVSTSRNWAVWVNDYLSDMPEGADMMRYVLIANAPEAKDNDFTWQDFQDRVNNELVAILGNFVNRTMVLMHKLCGGRVPKLHEVELSETDMSILHEFKNSQAKIETAIEAYKAREALSHVIDFARKGNKYMQDCEPWVLAKKLQEEPELQKKIDNCLHICIQMMANLGIFVHPFLPFTAQKIIQMLVVVPRMLEWENAGKTDLIKENYPLRAPELLFKKVEDDFVASQIEKLHANTTAPQPKVEMTEYIEFTDFTKVELKVGKVTSCTTVPKADKLLLLHVDLGKLGTRTILSGIAEHYQPEEVEGREVVVVTNLKPRTMRGIESQGMVLMTEDQDGKLVFISPVDAVGSGATVS